MEIININQLSARGGQGVFDGKKLIVFDLDGTLAPTKAQMDRGMSRLINSLLMQKKVAVIGGGKYGVFQLQLLNELKGASKALLKNLFLFPTTATAFYKYHNGWKKVYALTLAKRQVQKIKNAFKRVFKEIRYKHPKKVYGELIENRGSQVSFSFLGQDVVAMLGKKGIRMKERWKRENTPLKMKIAKLVTKYLPEFEVHAAGFTTIDVTRKGIDKSYGLRQIQKYLKIKIKDMLFVGDAIFKGGNDYAVVKTGVDYIKVKGPEETKTIIRNLLK